MSRSWKTSTAGILTIIVAICNALLAMFDADVATIPDWGLVMAAIATGTGLLLARDNKVTSEQARGMTEPPKFIKEEKERKE